MILFPSILFLLSVVLLVKIKGIITPAKGIISPIALDKFINFALSTFIYSVTGSNFTGSVSKTFASVFNVKPFGIFPASIR